MQGSKLLDEIQSDATAAGWLHLRTVDLIEAVEDQFLLFIADALAGIGYREAEPVVVAALHLLSGLGKHRDGNRAAIGSELIGIAQEIIQDLSHLVGVDIHRKARQLRLEDERHLVVGKDTEG